MTNNQQNQLRDILVFLLLIAIGTCGRWGQPEWCFTPIAAVAVFAGFHFGRWQIAAMVPIASLAISDLALPAYNNVGVLFATYAVMTLPVALGRLLGRAEGRGTQEWRWLACGLVPATSFYVVTNFAVWALQSDYPKNLAGLGECYLAAVPFYRWMLSGDVFYLVVVFGCYALAGFRVSGRIPEKAL